MRKLLNTLYVTTPDTYLALDGENVVVRGEDEELLRLPLHNLENIVTFGYTGASPALMGACAKRNIGLCFMTRQGRFLARVTGEVQGNVLLRRAQYWVSDNEAEALPVAKSMIVGKLFNSRWVLERTTRDHAASVDVDALKEASAQIKQSAIDADGCSDLDALRGIEGKAAARYFGVFDHLIIQQKEEFFFHERSRRPPMDHTNALLSFAYSLLAHEAAAALETVGLDPYMGFLHRHRPGRASLALDLMEELRPCVADRFVLSLINRREITGNDFQVKENGAVTLREEPRKAFLRSWQTRKQDMITHPFLEEKIQWGLVPYVQALLLARYLRGDLDAYPPFLWK